MVSHKSSLNKKRKSCFKNLKNVQLLFDFQKEQNVSFNRSGFVQKINDKNNNEKLLSIDSLSQVHLDLLMEQIRSNSDWNHKKNNDILNSVRTLSVQTSHNYVAKFINCDEECFYLENSGKYERPCIFEDLKDEIKLFTIEKLNCYVLDQDVLKNYLKLINERSINKLLFSWGFFWGKSYQRPFIDGQKREDVIEARKKFVQYFVDKKEYCFDILVKNTEKDEEQPIYNWKRSFQNGRIIIAHDESTSPV
ncbi:unnamed protein product [Brachionus calyciflorus]|uniref:Uncharacterized protein n=1 Tax=Brachionus calyciflorus TaxID=104777 RepID=A0A814HCJ4_9BILA|nr:unnamed protein product [Brachionus calyciflorus]